MTHISEEHESKNLAWHLRDNFDMNRWSWWLQDYVLLDHEYLLGPTCCLSVNLPPGMSNVRQILEVPGRNFTLYYHVGLSRYSCTHISGILVEPIPTKFGLRMVLDHAPPFTWYPKR